MTDYTLNVHITSEADLVTVATALFRAKQAGAALEGMQHGEFLSAPDSMYRGNLQALPAPAFGPEPDFEGIAEQQQYQAPQPQYPPAPAPQAYAPQPAAAPAPQYQPAPAPQQYAAPAPAPQPQYQPAPAAAPAPSADLATVKQTFMNTLNDKSNGFNVNIAATWMNAVQPGCKNVQTLAPQHYGAFVQWMLNKGWQR